MDEEEDQISLEELIDRERDGLGPNTTPVTLESFLRWKKRKIQEKKRLAAKEAKKKKKDFSSGKHGTQVCRLLPAAALCRL